MLAREDINVPEPFGIATTVGAVHQVGTVSIRTVRCTECGETRTGLLEDGETVPVTDACPDCGATEFVDVVQEE